MNWYLYAWRRWNDFEGRSRRTEYWTFVFGNAILSTALYGLEIMFGTFGIIGWLFSLAVLVPGIAVTMRRLHDTGRSGLWVIAGFVPLLNLVLIYFCVLDSDPGANRYGPNPKGV